MSIERPNRLGSEYARFDEWMYRFWKYVTGDNWVDYSKFQQLASQTLVGRYAAGTGNAQSIVIGSNLSLSTDGTLSALAGTATIHDQYSIRWKWAGTDTSTRTIADGYQMIFANQLDVGGGAIYCAGTDAQLVVV